MVEELFDVDGDGLVVLRLQVQPGAGRTEIVGRHADALKVRVAASPQGGRANDACMRLLAEAFEVKPSAVALVGGATSRSKRFSVTGVEPEAVARQLRRVLAPDGDRRGKDRRPPPR